MVKFLLVLEPAHGLHAQGSPVQHAELVRQVTVQLKTQQQVLQHLLTALQLHPRAQRPLQIQPCLGLSSTHCHALYFRVTIVKHALPVAAELCLGNEKDGGKGCTTNLGVLIHRLQRGF